jgi:F420H(2)-dependent quinone reductase
MVGGLEAAESTTHDHHPMRHARSVTNAATAGKNVRVTTDSDAITPTYAVVVASPAFPPPGSLRARLVYQVMKVNTAVYRASGGRLWNTVKGAPVLILHHTGRKSGQARTSPLLYLRDGDDLVIVASRGGSDAMPAWWLNLKASPDTTVELGRERIDVTAVEATPEEKSALWPRLVEMYPEFDVYQQRTARQIPVILLHRR